MTATDRLKRLWKNTKLCTGSLIDEEKAEMMLNIDHKNASTNTEISINLCSVVHNLICCSEGLSTINQQSSELAKAFMFWPSPDVREGPSVYDIR